MNAFKIKRMTNSKGKVMPGFVFVFDEKGNEIGTVTRGRSGWYAEHFFNLDYLNKKYPTNHRKLAQSLREYHEKWKYEQALSKPPSYDAPMGLPGEHYA